MSVTPFGLKINTWVTAANGDTYGDADRFFLRTFQALVQPNVLQVGLNTPPGSPTNSQTWVVGTAPTGAWGSQANAVAYWAVDSQDGPTFVPTIVTGGWQFFAPQDGWTVYDFTTLGYWRYSAVNTAWIPQGQVRLLITVTGGTQTLNPLSGNSFRVNLNNQASCVVTISNGAYDGQDIEITWVQGSGTATTVTVATNVHGFTTPTATINLVSTQRFTWDVTTHVWYAVGAGSQGM